eukprot:863933-Prorocentrum_minimum.AAC.3
MSQTTTGRFDVDHQLTFVNGHTLGFARTDGGRRAVAIIAARREGGVMSGVPINYNNNTVQIPVNNNTGRVSHNNIHDVHYHGTDSQLISLGGAGSSFSVAAAAGAAARSTLAIN